MTNEFGCELSDAVVVTVINCVGIEEADFANWSVYPNPLSSISTINLEGVDSNSLCQIRDASGRLVNQFTASSTTVWDASGLETGVYLIEVINSEGAVIWHSRAVIQ